MEITDIKVLIGIILAVAGFIWGCYTYFNSPRQTKAVALASSSAERFSMAGVEFISSYEKYETDIQNAINADEEWVQLSVDFYANHTRLFFRKFRDKFTKSLMVEFDEIQNFKLPQSISGNEEYQSIKHELERIFKFSSDVFTEVNSLI